MLNGAGLSLRLYYGRSGRLYDDAVGISVIRLGNSALCPQMGLLVVGDARYLQLGSALLLLDAASRARALVPLPLMNEGENRISFSPRPLPLWGNGSPSLLPNPPLPCSAISIPP